MTIAAVSRVQTVRRESGSGEFKLDVQQGGPFVGSGKDRKVLAKTVLFLRETCRSSAN